MRILLADDHELVRGGLKPFLAELSPALDLLEADSYSAAHAVVEAGPVPDLAILDLRMPEGDSGGLEALCQNYPGLKVAVLSGSTDLEDVRFALHCGAVGYIPKTFSGPVLLQTLRLILAGERFFPAFVVDALLLDSVPLAGPAVAEGEPVPKLLERLSVREREILAHMIQGGTNKEIARLLHVQEITVKVHLRNIYRKLGAANRAQAVRIALESGWTAA